MLGSHTVLTISFEAPSVRCVLSLLSQSTVGTAACATSTAMELIPHFHNADGNGNSEKQRC